jgi:hypothetical protein
MYIVRKGDLGESCIEKGLSYDFTVLERWHVMLGAVVDSNSVCVTLNLQGHALKIMDPTMCDPTESDSDVGPKPGKDLVNELDSCD